MTDVVFEFVVDSIDSHGLVFGRNRNGDIPVGTKFTHVRLSRSSHSDGDDHTEELGYYASISLTLQEVLWYGRSIMLIPGGHTAALRLEGDGLSIVSELLCELPHGDHLLLSAPPKSAGE